MASLVRIAAEGMSSAVVDQVPTLTEVVEWSGVEARGTSAVPGTVLVSSARLPGLQPVSLEQQVTELSANLLFELESKVSLALESRLREALAPVMARAAQAMVQEAQMELAALMRELVEEAVTQAIERHTTL
jgi:hypothetical protein